MCYKHPTQVTRSVEIAIGSKITMRTNKTEQIYKHFGLVMRMVEDKGNAYNLLSQVPSSSSGVSRLPTPRKITQTSIPPNLKRLGILETRFMKMNHKTHGKRETCGLRDSVGE